MKFFITAILIAVVSACPGVSINFNETIAHAIHSLTVQDLKLFDPEVTVNNRVPTVNRRLTADLKVLPNAPHVPIGNQFRTDAFNLIDWVLTHADQGDDGLGSHWLLQERIVHMFHMKDLWFRVLDAFKALPAPSDETCQCLMNTKENGIDGRLLWIAEQYKVDSPISLHDWGSKIPKLVDSSKWAEWRKRFSYYYTADGDHDPAVFLHCALKGGLTKAIH